LPSIPVVVAVLLALALAGCGRRGPLEPPPGAAAQPSPTDGSVLNETTPGTSPVTVNPVGQRKAKGQPIVAPKTKFILDPIL
jgi:predicted small lipoprotein YifL